MLRSVLPTCAALLAGCIVPATAQQQSPASYNDNLGLASQGHDDQGRLVITMQANGDLPGVLTLVVSTNPDGTIRSGEWALNVSFTAPLNPDAVPVPDSPDPDAAAGEQLIQRGVITGSIEGGSVSLNGDSVTAVTGLLLSVGSGSLQFASVSAGSGQVDATSVGDWTNSTGIASLSF
jgi:hypothetical protein